MPILAIFIIMEHETINENENKDDITKKTHFSSYYCDYLSCIYLKFKLLFNKPDISHIRNNRFKVFLQIPFKSITTDV